METVASLNNLVYSKNIKRKRNSVGLGWLPNVKHWERNTRMNIFGHTEGIRWREEVVYRNEGGSLDHPNHYRGEENNSPFKFSILEGALKITTLSHVVENASVSPKIITRY